MPSPFPGMDPFIESQEWPDFHHAAIEVMREFLTDRVGTRYIVRVEREFRDWLHGTAGYLYSHLSADAEFSLDTANPTGAPISPPVMQNSAWYSQRIVLERESHVANANALLGPWAGSTLG